MVESDTIKLLRECDAGIKMGVSSVDDSIKYVQTDNFRDYLLKCKDRHEVIREDLEQLLDKCHDSGKEPPAMAKTMAWVKTNIKLALNETDKSVAEYITDGCNMGIKSLSGYLNEYKAADEKSKHIAKELIKLEEDMLKDIRKYL